MSYLNAKILLVFMLLLGAVVIAQTTEVRLPGNNRGYEPRQPIAYSHRLHAGELGIDCRYCHYGAETSRHAGIPSASICMNCHRTVTAGLDQLLPERELAAQEGREPRLIVSDELRKLYDAVGLDEDLNPTGAPGEPIAGEPIAGEPIAGEPIAGEPIEWVRVHNMPDFAYFDHRVHVARDIACETCHGPVQSMERVRQFSTLSMGWCVDCHRSYSELPGGPIAEHVSTDCASCHF